MRDVHLSIPQRRDQARFLAAVRRSRKLHRPWVTPPDTSAAYAAYLERLRGPGDLAYFVCTASDELAGVINVSQIVHGVFRSAYLGYYALVPHAGTGAMKRGMTLAISKLFREHGLHRFEANIQPENLASRALIEKLGFELEGYSPRYLKIGGRWRDHERWAIRTEIWKPSR